MLVDCCERQNIFESVDINLKLKLLRSWYHQDHPSYPHCTTRYSKIHFSPILAPDSILFSCLLSRCFGTKVKGGVPSAGDVLAAIDDLESLYRSCSETGQLADHTFDFMKEPLKVDDVNQISAKLTYQPYQPPAVQVLGYDQFPTA